MVQHHNDVSAAAAGGRERACLAASQALVQLYLWEGLQGIFDALLQWALPQGTHCNGGVGQLLQKVGNLALGEKWEDRQVLYPVHGGSCKCGESVCVSVCVSACICVCVCV